MADLKRLSQENARLRRMHIRCGECAPFARWDSRWVHRLVCGRLSLCGRAVSRKRVLRLWHRAALHCPTRLVKRKVHTGARLNPKVLRPNDGWCYDFVHDALINGQTFRTLLVKDEDANYQQLQEGAKAA